MPLARVNAERALALDPSLAGPHAILARIEAEYEHNWAMSETQFARALTLDPTHVSALQWRSINLFVPTQRLADAVADVERARVLDPLSLVVGMSAALVRVMSGDVEGGMTLFDEQVTADPTFGMVHFFRSMALTNVGRVADAKASVERAIALTGGSAEMLALLAQTKAALGDTAGAEADLASLEARRADRYTPAAMIAKVYIALGRHDEAMEWLRTAQREREIDLIYLMAKDSYAPLRGREDFADLARAIGLAPARD
jgi:tetratricopeptide (TPR) repeat protein